MIVGLDTIAFNFASRLQIVNPARKYMGYMDAQQWPPKTVTFDAFYILTVADKQVPKQSIAVPVYDTLLQIVWINLGTDTNNYNNVVGANRGDRTRTCAIMKEECVKALWPYFAQKTQIDAQADGSVTATVQNEPVYWSKPDFRTHADKDSGLVYVSASVHLINMTEEINDAPAGSVLQPPGTVIPLNA